jgi:hypothetical protein
MRSDWSAAVWTWTTKSETGWHPWIQPAPAVLRRKIVFRPEDQSVLSALCTCMPSFAGCDLTKYSWPWTKIDKKAISFSHENEWKKSLFVVEVCEERKLLIEKWWFGCRHLQSWSRKGNLRWIPHVICLNQKSVAVSTERLSWQFCAATW